MKETTSFPSSSDSAETAAEVTGIFDNLIDTSDYVLSRTQLFRSSGLLMVQHVTKKLTLFYHIFKAETLKQCSMEQAKVLFHCMQFNSLLYHLVSRDSFSGSVTFVFNMLSQAMSLLPVITEISPHLSILKFV